MLNLSPSGLTKSDIVHKGNEYRNVFRTRLAKGAIFLVLLGQKSEAMHHAVLIQLHCLEHEHMQTNLLFSAASVLASRFEVA